jgi:hypothetical protein
MAHKGAGEETRNQGICPKATKAREAESRDRGDHQRGEGKTAERSKGERISNAEADDVETVCGILRMLLGVTAAKPAKIAVYITDLLSGKDPRFFSFQSHFCLWTPQESNERHCK